MDHDHVRRAVAAVDVLQPSPAGAEDCTVRKQEESRVDPEECTVVSEVLGSIMYRSSTPVHQYFRACPLFVSVFGILGAVSGRMGLMSRPG